MLTTSHHTGTRMVSEIQCADSVRRTITSIVRDLLGCKQVCSMIVLVCMTIAKPRNPLLEAGELSLILKFPPGVYGRLHNYTWPSGWSAAPSRNTAHTFGAFPSQQHRIIHWTGFEIMKPWRQPRSPDHRGDLVQTN
jgi:hypothetical protein